MSKEEQRQIYIELAIELLLDFLEGKAERDTLTLFGTSQNQIKRIKRLRKIHDKIKRTK